MFISVVTAAEGHPKTSFTTSVYGPLKGVQTSGITGFGNVDIPNAVGPVHLYVSGRLVELTVAERIASEVPSQQAGALFPIAVILGGITLFTETVAVSAHPYAVLPIT